MPNNFDSNFTRKLAEGVLKEFESTRVLSKMVNTQLLKGQFDKDSGDNVDFKRPTDYRSVRTSDGNVSGETKNSILTGKATGTVQDYITVFADYSEADQALKMGSDQNRFFEDMARRIVTDLEVDFADFMMKNCALLSGTVGTAADAWTDIAKIGALMESVGIPADGNWNCAINPFTQVALSEIQRSLGSGGKAGSDVSEALRNATIVKDFAGLNVMKAVTLSTYTTPAGADRAGTLTAVPTLTYVAAKDSMQQTLAVTAFQANLVVQAGDVIRITGRNRLNLNTRQPILTEAGANVLWSGVVTTSVTLGASGEGNIVVSGPMLRETLGQYNTIDTLPVIGDVVTLLGAASTTYQPNMFWHRDAYGIGSVPIEKLDSTDTVATTKDGLQMRVSRGSGFLENKNQVRFDLRPAYASLNPFFAGHGWGS